MPYAEHPGAYWGMFGPGLFAAHHRVRLRRGGRPDPRERAGRRRSRFAADNVLTVPSPGEAIEFFERMAAVDDPLL